MLLGTTTLDIGYTLASVIGSLGILFLTGLPLYFRWRKESAAKERTEFIVWDEIIGHPADPENGIVAKPALVLRVESTLTEMRKISSSVQRLADDHFALQASVDEHVKWSHAESRRLDEWIRRHERKFH